MKDGLKLALLILIGTLIIRCFFVKDWLLMAYWVVNFGIAAINFIGGKDGK